MRDFSKSLGWVPDTPDFRDKKFSAPLRLIDALPSHFSLRQRMPPVYDQLDCGSCTAQAIAAAMQYLRRRRGLEDFVPSRLAIYYDERVLENSVGEDAGAMIRDGIKVVAKRGVADEKLWPYDVRKFAQKPPAAFYREATTHQAILYHRINYTDVNQIKSAIYAGMPVIGGVSVYTSFTSPSVLKTGSIPMPRKNETLEGGHAILLTGYTDSIERFRFRNSWGASIGRGGYFQIPYAYITNPELSDDWWCITEVEPEVEGVCNV